MSLPGICTRHANLDGGSLRRFVAAHSHNLFSTQATNSLGNNATDTINLDTDFFLNPMFTGYLGQKCKTGLISVTP